MGMWGVGWQGCGHRGTGPWGGHKHRVIGPQGVWEEGDVAARGQGHGGVGHRDMPAPGDISRDMGGDAGVGPGGHSHRARKGRWEHSQHPAPAPQGGPGGDTPGGLSAGAGFGPNPTKRGKLRQEGGSRTPQAVVAGITPTSGVQKRSLGCQGQAHSSPPTPCCRKEDRTPRRAEQGKSQIPFLRGSADPGESSAGFWGPGSGGTRAHRHPPEAQKGLKGLLQAAAPTRVTFQREARSGTFINIGNFIFFIKKKRPSQPLTSLQLVATSGGGTR